MASLERSVSSNIFIADASTLEDLMAYERLFAILNISGVSMSFALKTLHLLYKFPGK